MRINEIESWPEVKLDIDNKVYIVYDENGKEISRHAFQHVWNSSPAKRAAETEVRELKIKLRTDRSEQSKKAAEAKPLSSIEQQYYELSNKVKRYQRYIFPKTPEDNILDKETRDLYLDTATKWLERMNYLANGNTVRRSVIDGTYKPPV